LEVVREVVGLFYVGRIGKHVWILPSKNNESLDKKTFSEFNGVLHNMQKRHSASEIAAWSQSQLQFCIITASNQKLSGRTWSKQTRILLEIKDSAGNIFRSI